MNTVLVLGLPVVVIVLIVILLKLRPLYSYLAIFLLGVLSPFVMDFIYCSVLSDGCKPDALKAVAFITMPLCVIPISAFIYAFIPDKWKHQTEAGE